MARTRTLTAMNRVSVRSSAQTSRDLVELIRKNLAAQRAIIDTYQEIVRWFGESDSASCRLLERVHEHEQHRSADLLELLDEFTAP